MNLVLLGSERVAEGSSFTLTGGVLDHDPIVAGSSASMVNGALNAFVLSAPIELERGLHVKLVSPGVITEALDAYASYFRGFEPVPAARAALAYAKSVEGNEHMSAAEIEAKIREAYRRFYVRPKRLVREVKNPLRLAKRVARYLTLFKQRA